MRAIRGAITVPANTPEAILEASHDLLMAIVEANQLQIEELVSVLFTLTPDLNQAFPAEAARRLGWTWVPLLCMQEIPVPGALPQVLRVLVTTNRDEPLESVRHVYLGDAVRLRTDLTAPHSP